MRARPWAVAAASAALALLAGEAVLRFGAFPSPRTLAARSASDPRPGTLILGDSFLDHRSGLAAMLARRAAREGGRTLNLARGGMRPLDSLTMMRRFGASSRPRLVLIGYTTANDLTDTLWRVSRRELEAELSAPAAAPRSWLWERLTGLARGGLASALTRRRAASFDAPALPAEHAPVNPYLALTAYQHADFLSLNLDLYSAGARHAWETNERILRRIVALAREAGARPVLVVFPSAPQVSASSHEAFRRMGFVVDAGLARRAVIQERAAAFCRREGLECVDLLPAFRSRGGSGLFRERDDHLSEKGEALAFEVIAKALWPSGPAS